eukprot:7047099-Karenia_brevis.AAC.1
MAFCWVIGPTWPPKGLQLGVGYPTPCFRAWKALVGSWEALGSLLGPEKGFWKDFGGCLGAVGVQ